MEFNLSRFGCICIEKTFTVPFKLSLMPFKIFNLINLYNTRIFKLIIYLFYWQCIMDLCGGKRVNHTLDDINNPCSHSIGVQ